MAVPDPTSVVIDERPVRYTILMRRGDTWTEEFRLGTRDEPTTEVPDPEIDYWDLTGWTGECQVRERASSDTVLGEIDVEIIEPQSDPDNKGRIRVTMTAELSALLPVAVTKIPEADLQLTLADGVTVMTPFAFYFPLELDVTRPGGG